MQLLHGKTSVAQNKKANETKINKQTEEKKNQKPRKSTGIKTVTVQIS